MSKKNNSAIDGWKEVIENISNDKKVEDELLSPSKLEMKYVVDYANFISQSAERANMGSDMAHQKLIPMDLGQNIMNYQKKQIIKTAKQLLALLEAE